MKKIILFIIILIILAFLFPIEVQAIENKQINTVTSKDSLFREIGTAVSFFEDSLTVRTTFNVKSYDLSFPEIAKHSQKINSFTGSLLNSMKYNIQPLSDGGCEINMNFSYYISEEQYYKLRDFADEFVKQMDGMSDYEKVKFTHDYLVENCTYNIDRDGPVNCLFGKQSNCNGYALSFCLIMQRCDIECKYITGLNHAWNVVKLDGLWYNIDVTWDDTGGEISYDYFLKGRADWKKHDSTEATAGYQYKEDKIANWVGTIFYYTWLPLTIIFGISAFKWIRRRLI